MSLALNGGALRGSRRISRFTTVALAVGCQLVVVGGAAPKAACLQENEPAAGVRQSAAPELASAIAAALNSALEGGGWKVTPAGEGSGFAFEVTGPGGRSMEFELPDLTDILGRVSRGEAGFAELGGAGITEPEPPPDWVPVYPGVRSHMNTSIRTTDLVVGGNVYVAGAGTADLLMWYFNWADRIGTRGAAEELHIPASGSGGIGRFVLSFDLWSVTVFATGDGRGSSLLVVLYTKFAEGGKVSAGDPASAGGSRSR
ncbi:MAG: hypothetical protein OXQ93_15065 [Gemmatimonadota bacterium]|nr:hypothetical protein [Gemmatimonadota bacterium]